MTYKIKHRSKLRASLFFALAALLISFAPAHAADIRVLSSDAMTEVMKELIPEFERESGNRVSAIYEPTAVIMERLRRDESADVIILIRQSINELVKSGRIVSESETDMARTSLAIAVKSGTPKPDISTADALRTSLLRARTVALSQVGASAIQFPRIIDRLGIADEMKPKLRTVPKAVPTATLVVNGEAEMAIQMMSELKSVLGAEIVGVFPGDLAYSILLTAAVDKQARQPKAASQLIAYLASSAAESTKEEKGMQAPDQ